MLQKERIKWFKHTCENKWKKYANIKWISETEGDLGDLEGLQFDSEDQGGYIYFWSSGYVTYEIYDYVLGENIVEDTSIEIRQGQSLEKSLYHFLKML